MDASMTVPANIDTLLHVVPAEALLKPFIAVTGLRDKMVKV